MNLTHTMTDRGCLNKHMAHGSVHTVFRERQTNRVSGKSEQGLPLVGATLGKGNVKVARNIL